MLSGLSNVIRNHLHLKVPIEVGVSDVPICIKDALKYLVLKSLNDVSVALSRASPQLYAVGPHRLQYLYSISFLCMDRADLLPMSQYIFCILVQSLRVFFLTWLHGDLKIHTHRPTPSLKVSLHGTAHKKCV